MLQLQPKLPSRRKTRRSLQLMRPKKPAKSQSKPQPLKSQSKPQPLKSQPQPKLSEDWKLPTAKDKRTGRRWPQPTEFSTPKKPSPTTVNQSRKNSPQIRKSFTQNQLSKRNTGIRLTSYTTSTLPHVTISSNPKRGLLLKNWKPSEVMSLHWKVIPAKSSHTNWVNKPWTSLLYPISGGGQIMGSKTLKNSST